jgi:DNA-binding LytR/AlgR family response regulator
VPGAQIHRSHWVADAHVAHLRRDGDQTYCLLDNGAVLPVGRRRRAEIATRYTSRPDRPARTQDL